MLGRRDVALPRLNFQLHDGLWEPTTPANLFLATSRFSYLVGRLEESTSIGCFFTLFALDKTILPFPATCGTKS